jgi:Beta-lactamase class C and other penicillin binding proteins
VLADLVTALVQAGAPGAAACLADGDTEWATAAGDAEPDGVFGIGSVTKTFVAAAALRLAADGVLALDAPAQRWCKLAPHDVTVRMLMDHSSRIPDYMRAPGALDAHLGEPERVWTPDELVALAVGRETSWQYSNTNAILLGLVIEDAAAKPLAAALHDLVLEPLGLHATTPPPPGSFAWAAGAMESTPRDVARFLGALLGGDFVDTTELQRTVEGDGGEFDRYGAGIALMSSILGLVESPCGPAWGHLGLGLGGSTAALSTPGGHRRLVVCTNGALDESGWRELGERVWPIFCNTRTAA